jgi:hypothetical protein
MREIHTLDEVSLESPEFFGLLFLSPAFLSVGFFLAMVVRV